MKKIFTPVLFFALCHLTKAQVDRDVPRTDRTQVINMDLIVQGSECVGFDCVNGESFGFSTVLLKENNLRIRFHDTSNSASFPKRDWEIQANETTNGGAEKFSIADIDAGRTPFTIEGGSINNALYVDSEGDVGIGTSSPVVEVHAVDGNTPTYRLEQNGSSGFTAQTWDLAGNETNFFIRDVTNGSKLPFRIKPNAPTNSLYVAPNGVGINTDAPVHKLHVTNSLNASNQALFADEPSNTTSFSSTYAATYLANSNGTDNSFVRLNFGDGDAAATAAIGSQIQSSTVNSGDLSFWTRNTTGGITKRLGIQADGNVIIGSGAPDALLSVNGTASKTGGGSWAVLSDQKLKKDIKEYTDGLEQVLRIKPVTFRYNGKGNVSDTQSEFVGIIAQEMQEVAPYTITPVQLPIADVKNVRSMNDETVESDFSSGRIESFLRFDPNAITYMLVNAVKEQQEMIENKEVEIQELKEKVNKLSLLEDKVARLTKLVEEFSDLLTATGNQTILLDGASVPFLGQNAPNPYSNETKIEYFLPQNVRVADVDFYDSSGKRIKHYSIGHTGKGVIRLKISDLPSGTYFYSLSVDGKVVDSKKMSVLR